MIFDRTLMFSGAQAITASAPSSDIVELAVAGRVQFATADLIRDVGRDSPIPVLIQIVEGFNNLTSLTIAFQASVDTAFTIPVTLVSQPFTLAQLTAGKTASIDAIPPGSNLRYLRLFYTVTGTAPTLGRITAGVTTTEGV